MATVTGATSGVTTIPQNSSGNGAMAQTLLNGISTINGGAQTDGSTLTATSTLLTPTITVVGIGGTNPTNLGPINVGTLLPNVVAVVINNSSTTTLANTSFSGNETIVGGNGGLFVTDNGAFDTINVGGGTNSATLNGTGGTFSGDGLNTITLTAPNKGATTTVIGTSGSSDTIKGAVGATGNLSYTDGGGAAMINPTAGNVTILGGSGGSQTVFGGAAFVGGTLVTTNSFTGSLTVTNGTGYFGGGAAGNNSIGSSSVGGSTLLGGGANDTLRAGGIGDVLIAGNGIATLDASTSAGKDTLFSSSNSLTYMYGSKTQGDTFFFGTSTVSGSTVGFTGSTFIAAHTAPNSALYSLNTSVSNTFAINGGAELGTVYDFVSGKDILSLSSAQGGTATLYTPATGSGQSVLTTTTGTTIAFFTKIAASDIQGAVVTTKTF